MNKWTPPRNSGGIPLVSTIFSLSMEMSRLTRDGTAESISRGQILRHKRGQGNIHFSSADHEQDWQLYPVDPYSCYMCDHTYIRIGGMCDTESMGYSIQNTVPDSFARRLEKRQQQQKRRLRRNEETAVYHRFIRLNKSIVILLIVYLPSWEAMCGFTLRNHPPTNT